MIKPLNFIFLCIGGVFGAAITFMLQDNYKPFDIGEAQTTLASLRPYVSSRTDAYIYLWADGTVNITFKHKDGSSEFRGKGNDVKSAVEDMKSKSKLVLDILK